MGNALCAGRVQSVGYVPRRPNSESVLLLFHWARILDGYGLSYRVVMTLGKGEHRLARNKVLDGMIFGPLPQPGK